MFKDADILIRGHWFLALVFVGPRAIKKAQRRRIVTALGDGQRLKLLADAKSQRSAGRREVRAGKRI